MKKEDVEKPSGLDRLAKGFASGASNLAALLFGVHKSACMALTLSRKGEFEWMAIMRAYDVEGHEYVVCFGNGGDPLTALMALNAAVGKGKCSQDKYAPATPPDWKVSSFRQGRLPLGGEQM